MQARNFAKQDLWVGKCRAVTDGRGRFRWSNVYVSDGEREDGVGLHHED